MPDVSSDHPKRIGVAFPELPNGDRQSETCGPKVTTEPTQYHQLIETMSTPRTRRSTLALACSILLAGCNGVADDDTVDRDPYGVDEEYAADEVLPGLTADGVDDPSSLWLHHRETLNGPPYVRSQHREVVDDDGAMIRQSESRTVVGEDGRPVLSESTSGDPPIETTIWLDADSGYIRQVDENESANVYEDDTLTTPVPHLVVDPIELLGAVTSVTVATSDADGDRYVLEGSGSVESYVDAEFTAVVTEVGYVTALEFEGDHELVGEDDELAFERLSVEFSNVGEPVDLERPEWTSGTGTGEDTDS